MLKEILEIPAVVERVVKEGMFEVNSAALAVRERRPEFVIIIGRGSSHHAGVYAKYMVETMLELPAGLGAPSVVTQYHADLEWARVLVIALSQSGDGPDLCSVTEQARRGGALTVAVSNEPSSPLAQTAEFLLECQAGPELSIPATKTYAAELVLSAAFVLAAAGRDAAATFNALPSLLQGTIVGTKDWLAFPTSPVDAIARTRGAIVLGRGYNLATALELGLKLKESAGIFAEAGSAAEYLHGPSVLAVEGIPIILFQPPGPRGTRLRDALGGSLPAAATWTIGEATSDRDLGLPVVDEWATPVLYAVAGQILAERVAIRRGLDPDRPRGLSKITRTV
jgi:glucosamine--fructose-6-phosphate aminotransferase (isomerizing)